MYLAPAETIICQGIYTKVPVFALLYTSRGGVTVASVLYSQLWSHSVSRLPVTLMGYLGVDLVDRLPGASRGRVNSLLE